MRNILNTNKTSNIVKRCMCFLLTVIMVAGLWPGIVTEVSADTGYTLKLGSSVARLIDTTGVTGTTGEVISNAARQNTKYKIIVRPVYAYYDGDQENRTPHLYCFDKYTHSLIPEDTANDETTLVYEEYYSSLSTTQYKTISLSIPDIPEQLNGVTLPRPGSDSAVVGFRIYTRFIGEPSANKIPATYGSTRDLTATIGTLSATGVGTIGSNGWNYGSYLAGGILYYYNSSKLYDPNAAATNNNTKTVALNISSLRIDSASADINVVNERTKTLTITSEITNLVGDLPAGFDKSKIQYTLYARPVFIGGGDPYAWHFYPDGTPNYDYTSSDNKLAYPINFSTGNEQTVSIPITMPDSVTITDSTTQFFGVQLYLWTELAQWYYDDTGIIQAEITNQNSVRQANGLDKGYSEGNVLADGITYLFNYEGSGNNIVMSKIKLQANSTQYKETEVSWPSNPSLHVDLDISELTLNPSSAGFHSNETSDQLKQNVQFAYRITPILVPADDAALSGVSPPPLQWVGDSTVTYSYLKNICDAVIGGNSNSSYIDNPGSSQIVPFATVYTTGTGNTRTLDVNLSDYFNISAMRAWAETYESLDDAYASSDAHYTLGVSITPAIASDTDYSYMVTDLNQVPVNVVYGNDYGLFKSAVEVPHSASDLDIKVYGLSNWGVETSSGVYKGNYAFGYREDWWAGHSVGETLKTKMKMKGNVTVEFHNPETQASPETGTYTYRVNFNLGGLEQGKAAVLKVAKLLDEDGNDVWNKDADYTADYLNSKIKITGFGNDEAFSTNASKQFVNNYKNGNLYIVIAPSESFTIRTTDENLLPYKIQFSSPYGSGEVPVIYTSSINSDADRIKSSTPSYASRTEFSNGSVQASGTDYRDSMGTVFHFDSDTTSYRQLTATLNFASAAATSYGASGYTGPLGPYLNRAEDKYHFSSRGVQFQSNPFVFYMDVDGAAASDVMYYAQVTFRRNGETFSPAYDEGGALNSDGTKVDNHPVFVAIYSNAKNQDGSFKEVSQFVSSTPICYGVIHREDLDDPFLTKIFLRPGWAAIMYPGMPTSETQCNGFKIDFNTSKGLMLDDEFTVSKFVQNFDECLRTNGQMYYTREYRYVHPHYQTPVEDSRLALEEEYTMLCSNSPAKDAVYSSIGGSYSQSGYCAVAKYSLTL